MNSISGYLLRSGRCQKRCPPHSVVSTDCYAEQCEAGWVVDGGKCYKQCGDGFYADSTAGASLPLLFAVERISVDDSSSFFL
jgi:hypothetical protein